MLVVSAWIATLVICLGLGVVSWRGTRPFAPILSRGWRGPRRVSRWFIWAPSGLLLVMGAVVAFHLFVTHRMEPGGFGLGFPLFWFGMITLMQVRLLIAARRKPRRDQKEDDR